MSNVLESKSPFSRHLLNRRTGYTQGLFQKSFSVFHSMDTSKRYSGLSRMYLYRRFCPHKIACRSLTLNPFPHFSFHSSICFFVIFIFLSPFLSDHRWLQKYFLDIRRAESPFMVFLLCGAAVCAAVILLFFSALNWKVHESINQRKMGIQICS